MMDKHYSKIENILWAIDFSSGYKQSVWEKVQKSLQPDVSELGYTALDDVAGGCSNQPDKKNKDNTK